MTSSSSKFFTWTKGDRKNASNGMVQIPVECIAIKDLGYGRGTKTSRRAGRKPLPLSFSDTKHGHGLQDHEPFTLHEVAVRSATSLLAAMSDVLKSPQFIAGQSSGHLQPIQCRPRSRTAPPTPATPLVEAPHSEPVELPASNPTSHTASAPSSRPAAMVSEVHSNPEYVETPKFHVRPHSSPSLPAFDHPGWTGPSSTSLPDFDSCRPSWDCNARSRSEDTVRTESSQGGGTLGGEASLMAHVTGLHTIHKQHITAMREAHDQELASHSAYIALLESQHLPTRHVSAEVPQPTGNATTSACSSHIAINQSRASTSQAQSVEGTRLEKGGLDVDVQRTTQTELCGLRCERNHLRSLSAHTEQRNIKLEIAPNETQKKEAALVSIRSALEASVAAANMQHIDALAILNRAQEELRAAQQREDLLRSQLDELEQLVQQDGLDNIERSRAVDCTGNQNRTPSSGRKIAQRPGLGKLDTTNGAACNSTRAIVNNAMSYIGGLRKRLMTCQDQLEAVKSDRERYDALLHSELRRQSRLAPHQSYTAVPNISQRAAAAGTARSAEACWGSAAATRCASNEPGVCVSESELRYCFEEIIMYKLDIKGYKKDLKSAHARIASLESSLHSQTLGRDVAPYRTGDYDHTPLGSAKCGLGITSTTDDISPAPASNNAAGTSSGPTPSPQRQAITSLPLTSPTRSALNPTSIHKALPEPPLGSASPRLSSLPPRGAPSTSKVLSSATKLSDLSLTPSLAATLSATAVTATPTITLKLLFSHRRHYP